MVDFRRDMHGVYRAEYTGRSIFVCRTNPKDFENKSVIFTDSDWAWTYGVKSMMFGDDIVMGHAPSLKEAKERVMTYMDATFRYA